MKSNFEPSFSHPQSLNRSPQPGGRVAVVSYLVALATISACSQNTVSEASLTGADAGADMLTNPISSPDAAPSEPDGGSPQGSQNTHTPDGGSGDSASANPGNGAAGAQGQSDASTPLEQSPLPDPVPSPEDGPIAIGESIGGLTVNSSVENQDIDLFGVAGHRFWLEVDQGQLSRMNDAVASPHDMYTPGFAPTFASHVVVQDAATLSVADYGKMEVDLVGSSTMRVWRSNSIPSLRIDTNEFQANLEIGTFEHIRLNNSVVGGIFREHLANRIYRALGYPALRSSYAFLGSNVWGEGVWVPMTMMEMYKKRFCKDNAELLGGGLSCPNMWEFPGDIGAAAIPADACQIGECDNTRLEEVSTVLAATPAGEGYKAALDPYISWTHFHQFQCLSWIMWTGDDMIHNSNNNLIIEREDGKLVWAPYSVDISAGQAWHQNVPLTGMTTIPNGCQQDPECWADTIVECEILIDKFDALNPELLVDESVQLLESLGMMREGDLEQAADLRNWFVSRQEGLLSELELYR